jgi:uncharacterized protein YoxC
MSVALEQFRRVNPYPGLMVDVNVWRDAHDYHRAQLHLHHLALHGWGIVHGLEVSLVDGAANTLRIAPGLAVDPAGNFVNVAEAVTYQITARSSQQVYIVLQLRELLAEPAAPSEADRASPYTRVVEAYRIQERDRLPEEPYIELARVDFVSGRGAVRLPGDPSAPGQNELDLRSRVRLGTSLAAPVAYAPPIPVASSRGDVDDGLAPRVEALSEQLRLLGERVDELGRAASSAGEVRELEELAGRVRGLAERVDELAAGGGSADAGDGGGADAGGAGAADAGIGGVAALDSRMSELTTRVEAIGRDVEDLARRVEAGGAVDGHAVGDGEGGAAGPDPRVSELRTRVDGLAGDVGGIVQRVDGMSGDVGGVTQRVETLSGDVGGVAQRVEGLAGDVGGVAQRVEGLAGDVGGLAGQVGGRAGRVEASSRDIEALQREHGALQEAAAAAALTTSAVTSRASRSAASLQADRAVLQLALAEHAGAGWDVHREGLRFLARELSSATQFDGRAVDPARAAELAHVDVLYLSGHSALSLSDDEADGVARVLDNGGVVIGEGCAAGPNGEGGAREFAMSFVDLATRLGRQLMRVDRGHALMHARHVFGEPPAGARSIARVMEASGMVYSDADYGCAWQGGAADKAMPRAAIRDAFEFGTNLATFRRQ